MKSEHLQKLFDKTVNIVFGLILVFIIAGIGIGAVQLIKSVWVLFRFEGITGHYIDIITDVLTLYVLVELSRSLVEYFRCNRLRMTYIVDAAIIFIIREVLINLFKHEIKPEMLYAISVFLLVLGALRIASIIVFQREKKMALDSEAEKP
ncbi:MAG: phosphate-starvation-inducible PsiE family protein [Pseudomonadales bacterium]